MAEARIIVDTGPLVAFLVAEDAHHAWAVDQFRQLSAPFFTCEPVLTEAFHLVGRLSGGHGRMHDLLDAGVLVVDFDVMASRQALRRHMDKYASLPMSLADACLVVMAEKHRRAPVFTVDQHFRTYRKHRREAIATVMPPGV